VGGDSDDSHAPTPAVTPDATATPDAAGMPEALLLSLLDHLPSAVTVWDSQLRLRFANKAGLQLLGATDRSEVLGRRWMTLVPDWLRRSVREPISNALNGQRTTLDRRVLGPDHARGHVQITFAPFDHALIERGFLVELLDITHRATTEIALRRHAEELAVSAAGWQRRANTDQLTGLVNRHHLERIVNEAELTGYLRALLLLDLDGFKDVNDVYGHLAGDEVLVEVANRLRTHVRAPDSVGRLGGDEFVVFVPLVEAAEHVEILAQRLYDEISRPIPVLQGTHNVTIKASVGVVLDTDGEGSPRFVSLLADADSRMYQAKQAGTGIWRPP